MKYSAGTLACLYLGALTSGCGGGTTTSGNFPVVVFSDVHFNPFYDPTLFSALGAADAGDWANIFKSSSITAPSSRGGDTNYPLLVLALAGLKQNLGASPLVVFTGDILEHGLPQMFYLHLNGTLNPGNPADVAAMQAFTDKVVSFFKVFAVSRDTWQPTNFSSLNYDLSAKPAQFNNYYTFSAAYASRGLLDASLKQLTPALVTNRDKQQLYRGYYYSGNNSLTAITYPLGNSYSPITDTTWPIYWSGIGNMDQQAFKDSVNTYPS